jgi:large subunit ribosomal protein L17
MLSNMAASLIVNKRINTTVAKAKALRMYIEPILTKAKEDTTHSRRIVFSMLQDKAAVTELFREISAKIADRPGGYTRIIKLGTRLGDNADMAMIELVDYNELLLGDSDSKKAKTTRRRRSTKKKTEDDVKVVAKEKPAKAAKEKVEEPKAEETEAVETVTDEPVATADDETKDKVE